jgi:hypothetical protein
MDVGPQKAGSADSPIRQQAALNNFSCQNIFYRAIWVCTGKRRVSPQCSEKSAGCRGKSPSLVQGSNK